MTGNVVFGMPRGLLMSLEKGVESTYMADAIVVGRDGELALKGGRHNLTGRLIFPMPTGAEANDYDPIELSRTGTLWSFTVQRFRPKSPPYTGDDAGDFEPFVVGYIELPDQLIVESRIHAPDISSLRIGIPMQLVAASFRRSDGHEVLIYEFAPIPREASDV
jgi:uncharacterized OB-fold protein